MPKRMTFFELQQYAWQLSIDHYRERTLLGFRVSTDGMVESMRKDAFEIIHFFERETDSDLWEQLKAIPDPDSMQPDPLTGQVDPLGVRSLAETWLEQWTHLASATGQEPKATKEEPVNAYYA